MDAFVNDLRYAQTTGVAVEVYLITGEKLLKGVHEVHEEHDSSLGDARLD